MAMEPTARLVCPVFFMVIVFGVDATPALIDPKLTDAGETEIFAGDGVAAFDVQGHKTEASPISKAMTNSPRFISEAFRSIALSTF
jgi:hypothetical protein